MYGTGLLLRLCVLLLVRGDTAPAQFRCFRQVYWRYEFVEVDGRLVLGQMEKSSPGAHIPRWRSRIRGVWLVKVDNHIVHSRGDIIRALADAVQQQCQSCLLTFSHPDISHGLTNDGIPQVNVNQLNPHDMISVGSFEMPTEVCHGLKASS